MRKQLIIVLACAWICSAQVTIQRDPALHETTYGVTSGDCRITWTVSETELNRGVIRHRPCAFPLDQQAPLLALLLQKVLASDGAAAYQTLSWGRLFPDGPTDSTMAVRLALAAKRSPGWDAAKGKPRPGDINGFVRQLANDAAIYEELRPVFGKAGLSIHLSAVEKVLVLPAAQLPFFAQLRKQGVGPRDRLPFDCQTWFSIRRTE